jgi:hypothetical protein
MAALAGFHVLMNYQTGAGANGSVPEGWPASSKLRREPGRANLIMFLHPKCACSRASVEELNHLLAKTPSKPAVKVFFVMPKQAPEGWRKSALWKSASKINGVQLLEDPDGEAARLFGAKTSGDVLVYDPNGRLLFNGGITPGRGHQGDNAGLDAVVDLISGKNTSLHHTPVYGCELVGNCSKTDTTFQ